MWCLHRTQQKSYQSKNASEKIVGGSTQETNRLGPGLHNIQDSTRCQFRKHSPNSCCDLFAVCNSPINQTHLRKMSKPWCENIVDGSLVILNAINKASRAIGDDYLLNKETRCLSEEKFDDGMIQRMEVERSQVFIWGQINPCCIRLMLHEDTNSVSRI